MMPNGKKPPTTRKSTSAVLKQAKGQFLTKRRFETGFDEEREDFDMKVQLTQKIEFANDISEEYQQEVKGGVVTRRIENSLNSLKEQYSEMKQLDR